MAHETYQADNAVESEKLLTLELRDEDEPWTRTSANTRRPEGHRYLGSIVTHVLLIAVYTTITAVLLRSKYLSNREVEGTWHSPAPYSPASLATRYSNVIHSNWNGDSYDRRYRGSPSPEVDAAWDELLSPYDLRIRPDEMQRLNRTSLELEDDSGDYYGSMLVYHHLHCLKMIRHWMAPDYYKDEMQHEQMVVLPGHIYPDHIEHCLDMLRGHLMCQPSTAIWTYHWDEAKNKDNLVDDLHIEHQCVDWETLDNWARSRAFDIKDGLILRPDGTPYRGMQ